MKYTCLVADPNLAAMGFSTVVAENEPRKPLAAFVSGADASAYCEKLNNPPEIQQKVSVEVVKPGAGAERATGAPQTKNT